LAHHPDKTSFSLFFDLPVWYSFRCRIILWPLLVLVLNIAITITIFAADLLDIKFFEQNKVFANE